MKETIEFRINNDYAHLLIQPVKAKNLGSVSVIEITRDNPNFDLIARLSRIIREEFNDSFFFYSNPKRSYTKKELAEATLLMASVTATFEPAGEENGTFYDESNACEICGANRRRVGPLRLKTGSLPEKDIARTIAGEIVVSEKFVQAFGKRGLRGACSEPVMLNRGSSSYYSLEITSDGLDLSENTVAGVNVFDLSESCEAGTFEVAGSQTVVLKEVYRCPKGHTIGLNLLSAPHVLDSHSVNTFDFFASNQKTGVKRGLLRPEPIYFCSPSFMKMVEEEKLSGFSFEPAQLEKQTRKHNKTYSA
jgi:hypothetical protein